MIVVQKDKFPELIKKFEELIGKYNLDLHIELVDGNIIINNKCKIDSKVEIYCIEKFEELSEFDLTQVPLAFIWKNERTENHLFVYENRCEHETIILEHLC